MEAKDLRIGNLVRSHYDIRHKQNIAYTYYTIGGIKSDKAMCATETLSTTHLEYEYLQGITLTEEWLLRFGFEKNGEPKLNGWWLKGICIEIIDGKFFERRYGISLKHVHQLQNLYYALTGEELTCSK